MEVQWFVHCTRENRMPRPGEIIKRTCCCVMHSLDTDDLVILNWEELLKCCEVMRGALPAMQNAILEWRANWRPQNVSEIWLQDKMQDIYDEYHQKVHPDIEVGIWNYNPPKG